MVRGPGRGVVVGGSGFMLSAILLMLEVQTRWWKPALSDIGWHSEDLIDLVCSSYVAYSPYTLSSTPFSGGAQTVGFWNLVGAVGFMTCGAFGYSPVERWVEQSALSTFWGEFIPS